MTLAPRQAGHLAMLAFSALVAGSFSLGAMAAPLIDPAALTVPRFALAGALVGAAASASGKIDRKAMAAPWRYLVLGGLLAIYFVLMFEGLKTAAPVSAAAVFTLTPLMAAGFGWVVLRQKVTARMALALTIGAAGAVWVIFRGDLASAMRLQIGRGEWIYFWGCAAHALYAPMIRRLNRGEPAVVFTFGMMVAGFLLLCLYGWRTVMATDWANLPAIVWICLVYVSVAASALSFVLVQFATLRLPAAKVMAYTYLVPSWVLLWEIALGRPVPPAVVLVGVVLTIGALGLLLKDEGHS
ncbi:multidrug DMT transporter [Gemmobacter aquaticus]|uniref:Multidrug DMT transporter n=1 Tax=Gemmobacter aquaticus TaxID=490185 RepID=A0A917YLX7_9RHOB|nr:DMT family transporter [Gemmobacter aquaticus]GGO34709.1 multidrug DMT transporter [Gemmobacter aquaticus]